MSELDWLDEERGLKSTAMTNREWIIWKLIDMSDEEFADRICGQSELWSCDDCVGNKINDYACCQDCKERFHEWLKQEHKTS